MQTVELAFERIADLQSALEQVLQGAVSSPAAASQGTCKLRLTYAGRALEVFALAKAGSFRLTDDPADLRYQVARFRDEAGLGPPPPAPIPELPPGDDEPEAPLSALPPGDDEPAAPEAAAAEDVPDEAEIKVLQTELGAKNPLLGLLKEIQKLGVPAKIKLAEDGDLTERTLLYRMYGKLVFDGLLRNPRITEGEVAKLAKLATIASHQLLAITRKGEWVRAERIRNALLSNPRLPTAVAVKIVHGLAKHELRPLLQRRDLPPPVQAAIREANQKASGIK